MYRMVRGSGVEVIVALASRFEDLRGWQAARRLTGDVYALSRDHHFARDFALRDQIRRAAISTMNNIAEGFDSASRTEFCRFLRYASRSASEVQSCLYIARDQRYIEQQLLDSVHAQAALVRKRCADLMRSLRHGSQNASGSSQVREAAPPQYTRAMRSRARPPTPVTSHRSAVTPLD